MNKASVFQDLQLRMENSLKVLERELKGLRTSRASVNLLDSILLEAYGDKIALSQVATVSTPDARTIMVQVWDQSITKAVEKAIINTNLGLNPVSDGQLIRVTIPLLSEERRKELVKCAYKYGENSKIALRNIRRDGNEDLKKLEKDNIIAKDEHYSLVEEIQKFTDEFSNKVDLYIKQKEQEILTI